MKTKVLLTGFAMTIFGVTNAQIDLNKININDRALGAVQKGMSGLMFSDADAANLSKPAVDKMDAENKVADAKDPYTIRLNKVFGNHKSEAGLNLNYKVYLIKEVNAFATADGSVRVFSGLMDIMDDNELLAVIGHEIGHVANHDSRDAMKAAYQKEALIDAAASQSNKVAAVTDGQIGKIANAILDSKHSRKQESEADIYAYEFLKRNKYNVNAEESAFNILAKMSEGNEASFIDKMMSSHPDSKDRAFDAKTRAEADGLYKPYVKQVPKVVTTKPAATKKPTKKPAKKQPLRKNNMEVKDSNGNLLSDGDSVTVIKDLKVRGSSDVIKRGTMVKNIRLTDDPAEIDCRVNKTAMVLRTEFVKKA